MFEVFSNGRPADCNHHDVDPSWDKSKYNTYEEALEYAWKWLGPYGGRGPDGEPGVILQINKPWDYSGYGDTIEIRFVE